MKIATVLGAEFSGGHIAFFAKCAIEAFAFASVPMAGVWRLPPLYQSGIRFALPADHGSGNENFQLPNVTFKNKKGDCDQLVIYRIWELLCQGERATCRAVWQDNAVHVLVRRANGVLEDPSILLGAQPQ
ncbi:MAG TPA: hypothetical protein VNM39_13345 [Verrucomicrobiae bacterium]|nr:hypothetical protein [Verrucomicrobiae bacterium]